jgi:hypothetical protein
VTNNTVVTVEQIQSEFPEFASTDPILIGSKLMDAVRLIDGATFGGLYDDAVKYYTCHLIALSPHGEFARLVEQQSPGGASTTYERQFNHIVRSAVSGPMVI